ncbi:hypothetical protein AB0O07_09150 [Streptomyces sp. NPDC093085]|uniref:Rv1733c family protein n=1 Tax=Streptomyces sp. NPDC093085 TaxID=3155068 RepID=UPI00342E6EF1
MAGLWRWRRNPLRRGTDLAEAWLALAALVLIAVAAPAIGWFCGRQVDTALRETVRIQQAERHRVQAVVVSRATERPFLAYDAESTTEHATGGRVVATWHAPDGTARTGTVTAPLRTPHAGDTFPVWADGQGRHVQAPMDTEAAHAHAVLAGIGIAALAVGTVEGGRRLAVWRLVRRRYQRLDQAWAEAGPDWGRTGTGS